MAVVFVEGFDHYNGTGTGTGVGARWSGGSTYSMTGGRFGGQALRCGNSSLNSAGSITAVLPTDYTSVSVGFAFRNFYGLPSTSSVRPFFYLLGDGSTQVGLRVLSSGQLEAYRLTSSTAGTLLGSSALGVIIGNTWQYVECEITISDTVGVFKVYVDGSLVINLTNVDTRNGTPTAVDQVNLGANSGATGIGTFDFDDVYVTDSATRLGERRVETLYPTGDVAQGWSRSAGATNYSLVDELTVNGDTDYVQASTVGDVDTYDFGTVSSTPTAIDAVQIVSYGLKTDAGTREVALQIKSGATTSDGSNFVLAGSYTNFRRLTTVDPDTSVAWTQSGVAAMQAGPKVTV